MQTHTSSWRYYRPTDRKLRGARLPCDAVSLIHSSRKHLCFRFENLKHLLSLLCVMTPFWRWFAFVHLQVALFQLPDVTLMVSVYNKRSMKRKDMIGWFSLGTSLQPHFNLLSSGCSRVSGAGFNNSGDEELAHWTDMRESKGEQVCRWHVLLEA